MPANQQSKLKIFLSSKIGVLVLFILLILIFNVVLKNISHNQKVDQSAQKLEQEIVALEKQNQEFSSLIEYFSSQEFVEKQAREKLNLGRPGEKVIIIPDNIENNNNQNKSSNKQVGVKIWWQYFFK